MEYLELFLYMVFEWILQSVEVRGGRGGAEVVQK